MAIHDYARSTTDGRASPRSADVRVYAFGDKPFRELHLSATEVDFPTAKAASPRFNLPVPARALIGDRVQDKAIVIDRATDGLAVLTGNVPRVPFTRRHADAMPAK